MVRRTSDIALLLGSRGRVKSRSGFGRSVRSMIDGWFGRSSWREERPSKRLVPGWLALIGVLAAFGGGFWCGDKAAHNATATSGLDAKPGKTAGFLDESPEPLAKQFLMAAPYVNVPAAEAKAKAKALAEHLQGAGLAKARSHLYPTAQGQFWVVAVYYDGESEMRATCDRMRKLPADVPDPHFVELRRMQESSEKGWPRSYDVR